MALYLKGTTEIYSCDDSYGYGGGGGERGGLGFLGLAELALGDRYRKFYRTLNQKPSCSARWWVRHLST